MTVALEASERRDSTAAVAGLLDGGKLRHRPDGRPEAEPEAGSPAGPCRRPGARRVEAGAEGRIGCDLEPVGERTEEVWRDLLGEPLRPGAS